MNSIYSLLLNNETGSETVHLKALEVKEINAFSVTLKAVDRTFHHLGLPMEVDFARIS